jgi:hypothetical protein
MASTDWKADESAPVAVVDDIERNSPPRYLMRGTAFSSYASLVHLVAKVPRRVGITLPHEILQNIAHYFTVGEVDPSKARALACSSTSGQHSLEQCLIDNDNSWWISSIGSFRNGKGEEYVEIELGTTLVRVRSIEISIPPLPRGPLSVRTLRLDSLISGEWRPVTPVLVVENRSGWQTVDLPDPIDVQTVRVVCLSNQASRFLESTRSEVADQTFAAVGFFTIRFE